MSAQQVATPQAGAVRPIQSLVLRFSRLPQELEHRSRAQLNSVALLTLGVAAIHFAAAAGHWAEYLPYGIFFIGLGVAQVGLAVAVVVAPSPRLFLAAAGGTAAVVGLWFMSRITGLPIAPDPWRPEIPGMLDMFATLTEIISVVLFLLLVRTPRKPKTRGRVRVALSTLPAVPLAVLAGWMAVGSALHPMPAAFNTAPAVPGQASTSVADLVAAPGSEPLKAFTLTAGVVNIGGHQAWAFNGTVPGPELHVTHGDRVRVTLVNHLPDPTSIHWHGLRLPDAADGVAGITQNAVRPGGTYVYEFVANDVGTYWFHSHQDTYYQLPKGLFGALVVAPRGGVAESRDYSLVVHTLADGSNIGVNGYRHLHLDAAPGETVRLRIVNANDPPFDGSPIRPALLGARYRVVALDGHDLNGPQEMEPERIPLGMGQRADLVFTMPSSGAVELAGLIEPKPGNPFSTELVSPVTIGDGPAPAAVKVDSLPRFDLTSYGEPAPDPVAAATGFDVTREIKLGGAPTFYNGTYDFSDTFSGQTSPYVPPITVREGQLVHLRIVNTTTGKYHPIHIHGHVFTVLAKNGHPLTGSPVHVDAILTGPQETWDVAFKADNPGIWMLHCHVLGHAAAGMSMTINYEGISTPFTMGSDSGNVPE